MWNVFLDWFDRHKVGVIGTLMLHTMVLFFFAVLSIRSGTKEEMAKVFDIEITPPMTEEEFQQKELQAAEASSQELKSLSSNVTAKTTSPQLSARAQARMAESIEEDLKAMEQAEFDRLREERAARGEEIDMPKLDPSKWDPKRYQEKTEPQPTRVEGVAMVEYDLKDRSDQYLHRPGFQCRGGGVVLIRVAVSAEGRVERAEVDPAVSTTTEDCLVEKALDSARNARFNRSSTAVNPQKGWIKYTFLGQ